MSISVVNRSKTSCLNQRNEIKITLQQAFLYVALLLELLLCNTNMLASGISPCTFLLFNYLLFDRLQHVTVTIMAN